MLDQLYELNKVYFRELTMYILAGKKKLEEEENEVIPALRKKQRSGSGRKMYESVNDRKAQNCALQKEWRYLELRELYFYRWRHRFVWCSHRCENVRKDTVYFVITIPLWKSQMIIALGVEHSRAAAEAQRKVSDLL